MAATLGAMRCLEDQDVYSHQLQNNCVIVTAPKSVIQGKRPLAPASDKSAVVFGGTSAKRKLQLMGYGAATPQQPASVARRNARERNRVKQVNDSCCVITSYAIIWFLTCKITVILK